MLEDQVYELEVSIHASVKDATGYFNSTALSDLVSIHASVKDATKIYVLQ